MSTLEERRATATAGMESDGWAEGFAPPRVFLQPIAAPSILGLAGFASATFIVASNLAGWWGTPHSGLVLAPFAAMFGGLAQFLAGMWAYRARDAIATLAHGTWGAFWMAYGILNILLATHVLAAPTPWYHNPEVGFWFFALAITTGIAALAATAESIGLVSVLSTLAAGSGILAGAYIFGSHTWVVVAGWVLVFSAGFAWYTVLSMVTLAAGGRTIFPLGKYKADANIPGRKPVRPIQLEWAEPGVKMGQQRDAASASEGPPPIVLIEPPAGPLSIDVQEVEMDIGKPQRVVRVEPVRAVPATDAPAPAQPATTPSK